MNALSVLRFSDPQPMGVGSVRGAEERGTPPPFFLQTNAGRPPRHKMLLVYDSVGRGGPPIPGGSNGNFQEMGREGF